MGTRPTNLAPGAEATLFVLATNVGETTIDGQLNPVTITASLPPGLTLLAVRTHRSAGALRGSVSCLPLPAISCTLSENVLVPTEQMELQVVVRVGALAPGAEAQARISGGATPAASVKQALIQSSAPVKFGIERYEAAPEGPEDTLDTQAGSHPFAFRDTLAFNEDMKPGCIQSEEHNGGECLSSPALPKDVRVSLPAGLVGNAQAVPQCTDAQFDKKRGSEVNECQPNAAVGVAEVTLNVEYLNLETDDIPIFNLVPSPGEPAKFGFDVHNVPVVLDTSVRTGRDYGVVVSSDNNSELPDITAVETLFWGVPGDPRHDSQRGWSCIGEEDLVFENELPPCSPEKQEHPAPFLTLPTSCSGPLSSPAEADSWKEPDAPVTAQPFNAMVSLDGCNQLPFSAGIETAPDLQQSSTPTGLKVDVHVPQSAALDGAGLAGSDVKTIQVTLPEGVTLNPAGADGLEACSESQIGYEGVEHPSETDLFTPTDGSPFCPDGAKIATAKITTPLLPHPLEGSVYLAAQNENPFGSLVAMYLVAEDPVSGVLVKLPGEVSLNEATDQISASFLNNPQLPFEDAELHFFGGDRAPLSTPAHCGSYTTTASITPWSGNAAVNSSSTFDITSGPNGGPCPGAALPFSPSLTAGNTSNSAGGFSPFTLTMSREDGQQNLKAVSLHMPPGLSGILTGVPLCGEAQADAGTCSAASLIGETTVSVGLGSNPYTVTGGKVYLTGGYEGAPFGLSIVNPANAGPFHLGNVIVRAKIEVDPITAALTVTSDSSGPYAIPPNIKGIPLQIKHINVTINRPGFTFNPTNCNAQSLTGTLSSIEGATATLPVSFQSTNCAALKFAPKFSVAATGKTTKAKGAGLTVNLTYPKAAFGSQANIAKVKVDLPKQLPSRLTTLQKACTAKQFELNPANCPKESKIGYAKVTTPLLPVPLEGPAIFVSHGGEAFPSLTIVLQGYGVTVDLVGTTFISKASITSTTFKTVPDLPFNTFQLTLPQGKFSALGANVPEKLHGNLCGQKLVMPTAFVAQNGQEIHESTAISVSGCKKAKKSSKKKHKPAAKRRGK